MLIQILKTPVNENHVLNIANGANSLWSALNNAKLSDKGINEPEVIRSVVLAVSDLLSSVSEATKNTRIGSATKILSHTIEASLVTTRLIKNLNIYWQYRDFNEVVDTNKDGIKYNQGLIPVTNILDIKADFITLAKKITQAIDAFSELRTCIRN